MATTAVDIVVKVAGSNRIDALDKKLKGTAASSVRASSGLDKSAKSAENLGKKANAAKSGVDKLTGAVKNLLAAAALFNAAKFVVVKTAELETQTRSLQVLTGSLKSAKETIEELQGFAAITPFTSSELIDTAKRLKAFGVETEKLVDTTKRLGDIAGATGSDLGGIATAFGQIQAKGRLQGEELLQLQERGINLQDELQKMYGLTAEEFRKALEKGRISAEAVDLALQNLTDTGGQYADGAIAQSDTLAGRFSTLIDNIEQVARTIGQVLTPALNGLLVKLNEIIAKANQALSALTDLNVGAANRSLATAGVAITFGATSQGIDQLKQSLAQLDPATATSAAGLKKVQGALLGVREQLKRIGPNDPNADTAVELQRVINQKLKQVQQAEAALKATEETIKDETTPVVPELLGDDPKSESEKKAKGRVKRVADFTDKNGRSLLRAQQERDQALFNSQMALEKQKFEIQKQYQEKLNKLAQLSLPSGAQGPFGTLIAISTDQAALDERERELQNLIKKAERALEAAKNAPVSSRMMGTPVSGGGGRYIEGGYGPKGPNHYGAHFDIKRADGSFFARNALDAFVRVNGQPLSSGYTVPGPTGGSFGAMRDGGTRVHNAWDYAFGGGTALTLQNGAKFTNSSRGSYGDNTVFMTPDGTAYRIIHGTFEPGPPGDGNVTMDQSGAISRAGSVDAAATQLEGAKAQLEQFQKTRDQLSSADFLIRQAEFTQSFKDQTEEIKNTTEAMKLRTGLELEGVRPEIIEGELKKFDVNKQLENSTLALNKALDEKIITQEQYNKLLNQANQLAGENVQAIEAQTAATIESNDALELQRRTEQLASSIAGEFTSAFKDIIAGTKTVEEAFADMLQGIGEKFLDFAMQLIQEQITQQLIGLFGGLLGGGFGGAPAAPSGGGATMFGNFASMAGFADGGRPPMGQTSIIGERGPEFFVPDQPGTVVTPQQAMAMYSPTRQSNSNNSISMSFQSTVINNVEYVTREEAEKMSSAAAREGGKMGEKRALNALQNRRSSRQKLGM